METHPILQSPLYKLDFVIALADLKWFCTCLILFEFLLLARYFCKDYGVLVWHVFLFKILSKLSPYFWTGLDLPPFSLQDLQRKKSHLSKNQLKSCCCFPTKITDTLLRRTDISSILGKRSVISRVAISIIPLRKDGMKRRYS